MSANQDEAKGSCESSRQPIQMSCTSEANWGQLRPTEAQNLQEIQRKLPHHIISYP